MPWLHATKLARIHCTVNLKLIREVYLEGAIPATLSNLGILDMVILKSIIGDTGKYHAYIKGYHCV